MDTRMGRVLRRRGAKKGNLRRRRIQTTDVGRPKPSGIILHALAL